MSARQRPSRLRPLYGIQMPRLVRAVRSGGWGVRVLPLTQLGPAWRFLFSLDF